MKRFFEKKSHEQKVILTITILVGIVGFYLFERDGINYRDKIVLYIAVNVILSVMQFFILQFFLNKGRTKNNLSSSTPILGTIVAVIIFLKRLN